MAGLSQFANYELGEAFFEITSSMVVQDGIPFSKVGEFDIVSPTWRKLADKENKSPVDIKKIDDDYKIEIFDLADSCILYMSAKLMKKDYIISLDEYKHFKSMGTQARLVTPTDKLELENYNKQLQIEFLKLANHGEASGDNVIDNKDFAAYIYALDLKSKHNDNNEFQGFYLNGKITPLDYAVAYRHLKEDGDNLFTLKLRQAYKILFES